MLQCDTQPLFQSHPFSKQAHYILRTTLTTESTYIIEILMNTNTKRGNGNMTKEKKSIGFYAFHYMSFSLLYTCACFYVMACTILILLQNSTQRKEP